MNNFNNEFAVYVWCALYKYGNCAKIIVPILVASSLAVSGSQGGDYVVALSETAASSQGNPISYENSTFGVYTDYPSDWDVLTPSYEKGDRTLQVVEFWSPDGTAVVTITRDIFDTAETLDTYLAETAQSYSSTFSNFTLLASDTDQRTLADNPAYSLLYSYDDDETGLVFMTKEIGTIIPGTDMAYYIQYNAPLIYYANNQDTLEGIIESLQFHIQLPETEVSEPPEPEIEEVSGDTGEI